MDSQTKRIILWILTCIAGAFILVGIIIGYFERRSGQEIPQGTVHYKAQIEDLLNKPAWLDGIKNQIALHENTEFRILPTSLIMRHKAKNDPIMSEARKFVDVYLKEINQMDTFKDYRDVLIKVLLIQISNPEFQNFYDALKDAMALDLSNPVTYAFSKMDRVSFRFCPTTFFPVAAIRLLFPGVKSLDVSGCYFSNSEDKWSLDAVNQLTEIETLDMSMSLVGKMIDLRRLVNLRSLNVENCYHFKNKTITFEGYNGSSSSLPKVCSLYLEGTRIVNVENLELAMPNLQLLVVGTPEMVEQAMKWIDNYPGKKPSVEMPSTEKKFPWLGEQVESS